MQNPFSRSPKPREGLPVLPGAFPLVGHIPALYRGAATVLSRARAEHGPLFWITLGSGTWVLVCTGPEAFDVFRHPAFDSSHLPAISPLVAGHSILALDGPPHRRMRSALNKPFQPRGLTAGKVGEVTAETLSAMIERWAAAGEARVLPDVQEAALAIIFGILGVKPSDLAAWRVHYRALLLANTGIKARFPGSPAVRAERAKVWIDARFAELVAGARSHGDRETLLGAIVHAEDDEGHPLADAEILDNLRLLVLGGHETISSALSFMTVELATHPAAWDALAAEAVATDHPPVTLAEARRLPFAEAIFRESLRLHPPFSLITRVAIADAEIAGRRVPKGSLVGIDLRGLGRDPAAFPDPERVVPQRWIGRDRSPTPLELSPFGAGAHFCLGYHLAWLEAVSFAATLGRTMGQRGLRPTLTTARPPGSIFLPTEHPPASTKIRFVPREQAA
ncbi:MAG: cytochrome P450 [Byssovorax sp.]